MLNWERSSQIKFYVKDPFISDHQDTTLYLNVAMVSILCIEFSLYIIIFLTDLPDLCATMAYVIPCLDELMDLGWPRSINNLKNQDFC